MLKLKMLEEGKDNQDQLTLFQDKLQSTITQLEKEKQVLKSE